jgi:mannose/cellobiose epimerase-like protein (N-acyl-D-glucosamine 2-epimerase family)
MTHVAAIGTLVGDERSRQDLTHGVEALRGLFHDDEFGGWYASVGWDGRPTDDRKAAYPHAFVILASASALVAGAAGAEDLLRDALAISRAHFWDDEAGMVVEQWDRQFVHCDAYRGVNANMHTVEAYLAAADAIDWAGLTDLDSRLWRQRAGRILGRVIDREARANDWRIPEHFDTAWRPQFDYNRDHPADPFRPYGATIGHGLEWARLCLQAEAAHPATPPWMSDAARHLYDRAVTDGWAVDGADGFVYTTDWQGDPVVRERMHWVVAEAIGATVALGRAGLIDPSADLRRWWQYADTFLIDHERGSWHHELDTHNRPSATVWDGKPDVYHALQATLLPDLPLSPSIVVALKTQGD